MGGGGMGRVGGCGGWGVGWRATSDLGLIAVWFAEHQSSSLAWSGLGLGLGVGVGVGVRGRGRGRGRVTVYAMPVVASMATRPCLSSAARYLGGEGVARLGARSSRKKPMVPALSRLALSTAPQG